MILLAAKSVCAYKCTNVLKKKEMHSWLDMVGKLNSLVVCTRPATTAEEACDGRGADHMTGHITRIPYYLSYFW